MPTRVTIWNEFRHEKTNPKVAEIYPDGLHQAIAANLRKVSDFDIHCATLDEPEHGLTHEVVNSTDVMLWWGHAYHGEAQDLVIERVYHRVLAGMGLIVLHSGHFSKIFKKLMGTTCNLKWRETGDKEILWVTRPGHPILQGIDDHIVIEHEEMYGEYFDIPEPQETLLISTFSPGGECFRSGCTWTRGAGRIFYFRPGHETYPTYHNPTIIQVIANAIRWAAPTSPVKAYEYGNRKHGWLDEKKQPAT
jgi:trehalose utilization protein